MVKTNGLLGQTWFGSIHTVRPMSTPQQFDKVRFNAGTAVFRLGYSHYNKGIGPREPKLPRGWADCPADPKCMIHPARLKDAVRYFDISLGIWPGETTALNLKALTLKMLGEFSAAARAYTETIAAAKVAGLKPSQDVAEEGLRYCNARASA